MRRIRQTRNCRGQACIVRKIGVSVLPSTTRDPAERKWCVVDLLLLLLDWRPDDDDDDNGWDLGFFLLLLLLELKPDLRRKRRILVRPSFNRIHDKAGPEIEDWKTARRVIFSDFNNGLQSRGRSGERCETILMIKYARRCLLEVGWLCVRVSDSRSFSFFSFLIDFVATQTLNEREVCCSGLLDRFQILFSASRFIFSTYPDLDRCNLHA